VDKAEGKERSLPGSVDDEVESYSKKNIGRTFMKKIILKTVFLNKRKECNKNKQNIFIILFALKSQLAIYCFSFGRSRPNLLKFT